LESICEEILKGVPHRHFVFSIPKILRRYFLFDRTLFSELSRCARGTLKEFFQESVPEQDAVPGAIIAIHSFGDFLGRHPHLHVLCTDGCFYGSGMFRVAPLFELKHLEELFRHKGSSLDRKRPWRTSLGISSGPLSLRRECRSGHKRTRHTVSTITYPSSPTLMSGLMWTLSIQRSTSTPSLNSKLDSVEPRFDHNILRLHFA